MTISKSEALTLIWVAFAAGVLAGISILAAYIGAWSAAVYGSALAAIPAMGLGCIWWMMPPPPPPR